MAAHVANFGKKPAADQFKSPDALYWMLRLRHQWLYVVRKGGLLKVAPRDIPVRTKLASKEICAIQ